MAKEKLTVEEKSAKFNSGFNLVGIVLGWVKDYGWFNMFMACVFTVFVSLTIRIIYDPGFVYHQYQEYAKSAHMKELAEQHELDLKVKQLLPKLLGQSLADRAWIFNYHNGTATWEHGSMRFEECQEGVTSIKAQYINIPLSWLRLPDVLRDQSPIFIGSMDDLYSIDKVLAERLKQNGINYLACIALTDINGTQTGVLGFTWTTDPTIKHSEHVIHDNLIKYGAIIEQYVK